MSDNDSATETENEEDLEKFTPLLSKPPRAARRTVAPLAPSTGLSNGRYAAPLNKPKRRHGNAVPVVKATRIGVQPGIAFGITFKFLKF